MSYTSEDFLRQKLDEIATLKQFLETVPEHGSIRLEEFKAKFQYKDPTIFPQILKSCLRSRALTHAEGWISRGPHFNDALDHLEVAARRYR